MIKLLIILLFIPYVANAQLSIAPEDVLKCDEDKILEYSKQRECHPDPSFDPEKIIAESKDMEVAVERLNAEQYICEDVVIYQYNTEVVVPAVKGEEINKRTESSQFFKKDIVDGKQVWEARIWGAPEFLLDGIQWEKIGYGKSIKDAWNEQVSDELKIDTETLITRLFSPTYAHAQSEETFTSDAGGDGDTNQSVFDVSPFNWFGNHCAAGDTVINNGITIIINSTFEFQFGSVWFVAVRRGFIPFDTTSLPPDITIDAATIKLRVTGSGGTPKSIALVQTTQDNPIDLVLADHVRCGDCPSSPTEGSDTRITDPIIGTYETFTLNADGESWIVHDETNFSKFGLRTSRDIDDTGGGSSHSGFISVASSNNSTGDWHPLLTVTYTEGGGAARRIMNIN